jgi:Cysteine-rich secretory protein family
VLGENLAWGTGALATPGSIMQAWMNSPGHRENVLNPDYREVGVGVVAGNPAAADGLGATYATEFGVIEGAAEAAAAKRRTAGRRVKRQRRRAARQAKARIARRAGTQRARAYARAGARSAM